MVNSADKPDEDTSIEQKMYTFEWIIDEFCAKCNNNIPCLVSETFFPFGEKQLGLWLAAHAIDVGNDVSNSMYCLKIRLHVANSTPRYSKWSLCVVTITELAETKAKDIYAGRALQLLVKISDQGERRTSFAELTQHHFTYTGSFASIKLLERLHLYSTQPLIVRCIICNVTETLSKVVHRAADEQWYKHRLFDHLQQLLVDDKSNDCTLITQKQQIETHASRTHLCARSSVFRAMFASRLSEAETNRVLIVDFDAKIVKHFVEYIHLGCVTAVLKVGDHLNLLRIADKYDVQGLKKLAVYRLIPQLALTNIAAIFNLAAFMQDVDELTAACSKFLAKNRSEVMKARVLESLSCEAKDLLLAVTI